MFYLCVCVCACVCVRVCVCVCVWYPSVLQAHKQEFRKEGYIFTLRLEG